MNTSSTLISRAGVALAAILAGSTLVACGTAVPSAPSQIDRPQAPVVTPEAPDPDRFIDKRPCAPTVQEARAERRTLCV